MSPLRQHGPAATSPNPDDDVADFMAAGGDIYALALELAMAARELTTHPMQRWHFDVSPRCPVGLVSAAWGERVVLDEMMGQTGAWIGPGPDDQVNTCTFDADTVEIPRTQTWVGAYLGVASVAPLPATEAAKLLAERIRHNTANQVGTITHAVGIEHVVGLTVVVWESPEAPFVPSEYAGPHWEHPAAADSSRPTRTLIVPYYVSALARLDGA